MTNEGLAQHQADSTYWYSADGLPYGYSIDEAGFETEPEELQLVELAAGMTIRSEIGLHIFVSDLAGRPALGRMAQQVSRWTDGWVFVEFNAPPPADLLDHLSGAGRCIRVTVAVYLDAAAMRAWIDHPDFHVVK